MKTVTFALSLLITAAAGGSLGAQHSHGGHNADSSRMVAAADAEMSGPRSEAARKHLELSPARRATREDSARALQLAKQLRAALAKYADTAAAVADGYRLFAPNLKNQRVYHFTNYRNAFVAGFRFDPERPTSILYQRDSDGQLQVIGAMYTAPKAAGPNELNERVPISIARWHKHVNWCVPRIGQGERWLERRDNLPLFGPESPIATREECRKAGGMFLPSPMGWMIHANVFLGYDLGIVFGHEH